MPIDNNHQANPNCTVVGCAECIDDPAKCDKCDSGYAINVASCIPCGTIYDNCTTCEFIAGSFICNTCDVGLFPMPDKCALCDTNVPQCIACTNDGITCKTCKANYVLTSNKCVKCSEQISDCESCE